MHLCQGLRVLFHHLAAFFVLLAQLFDFLQSFLVLVQQGLLLLFVFRKTRLIFERGLRCLLRLGEFVLQLFMSALQSFEFGLGEHELGLCSDQLLSQFQILLSQEFVNLLLGVEVFRHFHIFVFGAFRAFRFCGLRLSDRRSFFAVRTRIVLVLYYWAQRVLWARRRKFWGQTSLWKIGAFLLQWLEWVSCLQRFQSRWRRLAKHLVVRGLGSLL